MNLNYSTAVRQRRSNFTLAVCISLAAFNALAGCVYAFVTEIEDLRLESIDHVALTRVEIDQEGNWYQQIDGHGEVLRIKLSTRDSLTDALNRRGLSYARFDMFFCDEGASKREVSGQDGWVYAGEDQLRFVHDGKNEMDVPRPPDGRYIYSILVDKPAAIYKSEYVDGQRVQVGTLDFERPPKPVCIQIYATQMLFGKTIRTNVVALQTWNEVMFPIHE